MDALSRATAADAAAGVLVDLGPRALSHRRGCLSGLDGQEAVQAKCVEHGTRLASSCRIAR